MIPSITSHNGRTVGRLLMLVTGAIASCTTFSDAVDPGVGSVFEDSGGSGGAGGATGSSGKGGSVSKGGAGGSGGGNGGAKGGSGGTGGANQGGMAGNAAGQGGSSAGSAGATGTGGSAGAPTPGSPVDICMKTVNGHRQIAGLPAYARWAAGEACGSQQAEAVCKGQAEPDLSKCGAWAGTICPGWPGPQETMIIKCIDQMWAAPGPPHDYLASTTYTELACGFFENTDSKVWATQMFR